MPPSATAPVTVPTKESKSPRESKHDREPASYEGALAELDRLVQQMEGGQLPLDQLLDGYRRGAVLLSFCRSRLQAVEDQVKLLDEGQLKPWVAP